MPLSDLNMVFQWWGTLFIVGAFAFPLTRVLFRGWPASNAERPPATMQQLRAGSSAGWWDEGYSFSKAIGIALASWLVYSLGTVRILPFYKEVIWLALLVVLIIGVVFEKSGQRDAFGNKRNLRKLGLLILVEEIFFFAALLFWSWIKAHEPSIRGLEKFMDYGFMKSILDSAYFPPSDMWYAGHSINYYYFGHLVTAVLTKFSGLDLGVTFNLMLATIFAFTLTMSFSIGVQLSKLGHSREGGNPSTNNYGSPIRPCLPAGRSGMTMKAIFSGCLTAFLVTLAGNMQTIYAFTKGYEGDKLLPFWQLFWNLNDWKIGRWGDGLQKYWYANATRFIPFTIHEFPSYSFVVSDVHGHVLSLPFVLLTIGLLIVTWPSFAKASASKEDWMRIIFYGFMLAVLFMTNATDALIYGGLLIGILVIGGWGDWAMRRWGELKNVAIKLLVAGAVFFAVASPFTFHFESFVSGIAVNCPPAFLANVKIGPLLFESIEKCQKSPIWMMWLLWGFFIYCGMGLIYIFYKHYKHDKNYNQTELLLLIFFVFSIALIIIPEFFYFKDIYPAHFRSNTMFKLGYQAFIMFSIVSAYSIIKLLTEGFQHKFSIFNFKFSIKAIFLIFLVPQLLLVSIFPIFSVRSYFNSLKNYESLDGLGWLRREYADDWAAIEWINQQKSDQSISNKQDKNVLTFSLIISRLSPHAIVEADGDSYTDYNHFSVFTGRPTIVGWAVHEWLWRKTYDVVSPRREEVRKIYESSDLVLTRELLTKYNVRWVIIGKLEREKFTRLDEGKLERLGKVVFSQGKTIIYEVEAQ